jgi:hypothetical protein
MNMGGAPLRRLGVIQHIAVGGGLYGGPALLRLWRNAALMWVGVVRRWGDLCGASGPANVCGPKKRGTCPHQAARVRARGEPKNIPTTVSKHWAAVRWSCKTGNASSYEPLDLSTDLSGVYVEDIIHFILASPSARARTGSTPWASTVTPPVRSVGRAVKTEKQLISCVSGCRTY